MRSSDLQPRVDYIFCDHCQKHVPCIRVQPGVWEVQCPNCVGECALCGCHLVGYCFGAGNVPVKTHMYLVKPPAGSEKPAAATPSSEPKKR